MILVVPCHFCPSFVQVTTLIKAGYAYTVSALSSRALSRPRTAHTSEACCQPMTSWITWHVVLYRQWSNAASFKSSQSSGVHLGYKRYCGDVIADTHDFHTYFTKGHSYMPKILGAIIPITWQYKHIQLRQTLVWWKVDIKNYCTTDPFFQRSIFLAAAGCSMDHFTKILLKQQSGG